MLPRGPKIHSSPAKLPRGTRIVDSIASATRELFFIEHPRVRKDDPELRQKLSAFTRAKKIKSVWVYYPWLKVAVRMPREDIYFKLRTASNRNLITEKEQKAYRKAVVGIAGLSVGSAAAGALTLTGGPKVLKIADADVIETTNLNRIRAKLPDIGANKADVAARNIWELDPFMDIRLFREGLTEKNLHSFLTAKPKLDIFVDEMDDIAMKIETRLLCRTLRIPVLMATDNGDGAILDVERYDRDQKLPLFHGRVGTKPPRHIEKKDGPRWAAKIIDPAYLTERQQDSLLGIGKTLAGVAQLGTAASIAGAAIAFAVRRIANKQPLPSGRYRLGTEEALIPGYNSVAERKRRSKHTQNFADTLGLKVKCGR